MLRVGNNFCCHTDEKSRLCQIKWDKVDLTPYIVVQTYVKECHLGKDRNKAYNLKRKSQVLQCLLFDTKRPCGSYYDNFKHLVVRSSTSKEKGSFANFKKSWMPSAVVNDGMYKISSIQSNYLSLQ